MELVIIIGAIVGLVLYILFSDPKPVYDETWAEVFKTLKDAGIEPCFMRTDK